MCITRVLPTFYTEARRSSTLCYRIGGLQLSFLITTVAHLIPHSFTATLIELIPLVTSEKTDNRPDQTIEHVNGEGKGSIRTHCPE